MRLFRVLGITVYVHWTWFLVAAVQWQIGRFGAAWHVATYLTLFGIVLLHEFGHALACRSVGGWADRIVLWPLGGIAFVQPPPRPGPVLWSIAAGPLVNVLLVPVTGLVFILSGGLHTPPEAWTHWQWYVGAVMLMNFSLLAFNLLPIYPLDGGQMFQAVLWFFMGRARSLRVAASVGLVGAILGGVAAMMLTGSLWLAVMALFLAMESWGGLRHARLLAQNET